MPMTWLGVFSMTSRISTAAAGSGSLLTPAGTSTGAASPTAVAGSCCLHPASTSNITAPAYGTWTNLLIVFISSIKSGAHGAFMPDRLSQQIGIFTMPPHEGRRVAACRLHLQPVIPRMFQRRGGQHPGNAAPANRLGYSGMGDDHHPVTQPILQQRA